MWKTIITLALPIMLSQGLQTLMVLTDRILLSMKSPVLSTVATTAGFTAISLSYFFLHLLQFSTCLIAKAYGRGSQEDCRRVLSQGLFIATLSVPALLIVSLAGNPYFLLLGHPDDYRALELDYFFIMIAAQIPVLFRVTLEAYLLGINRSRPIFFTSLMAAFFNIPLSYCFVLGPFSSYFMGATGAAWGTFLANFISLLFLIVLLSKSLLSCIEHFNLREIVQRSDFKTFLSQGAFAGLEKFTNSICFVSFVNMFVHFSKEISTAVAIVFTWDQIAFLPLMGMYGAQMSVYSRYLGQNSIELANKSLNTSILLAVCVNVFFSIFFLCYSETITSFMLQGDKSAIDVAMTTSYSLFFLKTTCFYIFANALMFLFKAVLRSLGHSRWCFRVSLFIHLLLVSISYVGIYNLNFGPTTIWFLFLTTTGTMTALFIVKYYSIFSLCQKRKFESLSV